MTDYLTPLNPDGSPGEPLRMLKPRYHGVPTITGPIELRDCRIENADGALYHDPHPSWDPNNYRNTITPPDDLHALQARFDTEHAAAGEAHRATLQRAEWQRAIGWSFAIIAGIMIWVLIGFAGEWVLS